MLDLEDASNCRNAFGRIAGISMGMEKSYWVHGTNQGASGYGCSRRKHLPALIGGSRTVSCARRTIQARSRSDDHLLLFLSSFFVMLSECKLHGKSVDTIFGAKPSATLVLYFEHVLGGYEYGALKHPQRLFLWHHVCFNLHLCLSASPPTPSMSPPFLVVDR